MLQFLVAISQKFCCRKKYEAMQKLFIEKKFEKVFLSFKREICFQGAK
jgi:hypothetical protein